VTLTPSNDSFVIRTWKQADLAYVADSIQREGWGHSERDVERCWNLEPEGCFIAESENKPVGHVFSVLYGKIGWIGLLIVNPEKRGLGIGAALMKTAINYLEENGAETTKLEAEEKAVPLYRRLGFVDEFDSLRYCGMPKHKNQLLERGVISPIRRNDIHKIAEFDAQHFGANRLPVLKSLLSDFPQYCFAARENKRIEGYIMARKTLDELWVGPWICSDSRVVQVLYNRLFESVQKETVRLRLGFPALNTNARKLVEELGLQLAGKSIHMIRGNRKNQGDVKHIYGIGGSEKG
jgi:ribosomal protein S18 acetylase RimI-like enzyme